MMYPFMTLDDNTEVVHSEMLPDGRVKVYFEKPDAKLHLSRPLKECFLFDVANQYFHSNI